MSKLRKRIRNADVKSQAVYVRMKNSYHQANVATSGFSSVSLSLEEINSAYLIINEGKISHSLTGNKLKKKEIPYLFQMNSSSSDHASVLFNVSAKNQLKLIALADNKANVITAISIVLIAMIIALFTSGVTIAGESIAERLDILIPLCILMLFFTVSAICAILALKPKIIRTSKKKSKSMLFFHNFYRKTLQEYKEEMNVILESEERVYNQLVTDMYYNGLVLERKYALLGISYTLFLLALVFSVSAFVILSVV